MLSEPLTMTASPGRIAARDRVDRVRRTSAAWAATLASAARRRGSASAGRRRRRGRSRSPRSPRRAPRAGAAPSRPSSIMSPSTAMRRPPRPQLDCAEIRERRAHRGRVGVVALVDQQSLAVADGEHGALAAPDRRLQVGEAPSAASARSAPSACDGGEHAERIQRDVPAGRADPVGRAAGRRSRASTIERSGFTTMRSARTSAASCSPKVTMRPAGEA